MSISVGDPPVRTPVATAGRVGVDEVVPAPPFDFVTSKVRVPAVRSDSVPRIGLVNRLRATRSSALVVVTAPAGYGKTTLLAQWARRDERPSAWVSIDSRDNDPVILLRHIAVAVSGTGPIDPAVLPALRSPGRAIWRVGLPRLATAIAALPHPFVLVLDEADLLDSQESLDVLSTIAEQIPEGSTLALAGRTQPRLGMARLRASARLFEIGPETLALSRREAHLLLRATGLELTDREVSELVARTEGWPAGLYLAALTLHGRNADGDRPMSITGEDRYVAEYLRSEHLAQLEPDMREFLVRSSVLGKMCGSLCDAVLETEASGARLESMRASNLFLVPLDDHCEWYRYHHLFQELLRHELSQSDAEAIPALNRRAADWYEAHGEPEAALEPAADSGDMDRAARIFAEVALPAYHTGRLTTIEGWLDHFPGDDRLAQYPAVGVLGSWIHALRGRPAASADWLRASEHGTDTGPLPDGSTSARPWIAVLRSGLCRDGIEQMRTDAEDALIELPRDSRLRPAALTMHGAAHVLLGDAEQGDLILALAADEATRARSHRHPPHRHQRALAPGQRPWRSGGSRRARVRGARTRRRLTPGRLSDHRPRAGAVRARPPAPRPVGRSPGRPRERAPPQPVAPGRAAVARRPGAARARTRTRDTARCRHRRRAPGRDRRDPRGPLTVRRPRAPGR